jgi:hypothetical protein
MEYDSFSDCFPRMSGKACVFYWVVGLVAGLTFGHLSSSLRRIDLKNHTHQVLEDLAAKDVLGGIGNVPALGARAVAGASGKGGELLGARALLAPRVHTGR